MESVLCVHLTNKCCRFLFISVSWCLFSRKSDRTGYLHRCEPVSFSCAQSASQPSPRPVLPHPHVPGARHQAGLCVRWEASQSEECCVSTKTQEFLRLLELMGVPRVMAPGDGEALCAHLVRSGVVDAVASEDMDTLAFGGTVLLRQLNAKRDSEVTEYSLPKLLEALQLTQEEFVDLCILLGCDYCDKITGLGPSRALKLIQQHRTIEHVMQNVNRKTHPVPPHWQFKAARRLFLEVPQTEPPKLNWTDPDEEGLVKFLCVEKHVKEERVRGRMEKFRQTLTKRRKQREDEEKAGTTRQSRLDEFFRVTRKRQSADAVGSTLRKRAKAK
uniref:XPG-I domain-containing protein n=1 Tax=Pygocentrus nattereri TaxID=42514 RepID=A0AAR2LE91_PYGNA